MGLGRMRSSDRSKEWKDTFRTIMPQRKGKPGGEGEKASRGEKAAPMRGRRMGRNEFRDIHGSIAYKAHFDENSAYRTRERTTPLNGGFPRVWLSRGFVGKTRNSHNPHPVQNHYTIGGCNMNTMHKIRLIDSKPILIDSKAFYLTIGLAIAIK